MQMLKACMLPVCFDIHEQWIMNAKFRSNEILRAVLRDDLIIHACGVLPCLAYVSFARLSIHPSLCNPLPSTSPSTCRIHQFPLTEVAILIFRRVLCFHYKFVFEEMLGYWNMRKYFDICERSKKTINRKGNYEWTRRDFLSTVHNIFSFP